MQVVYPSYYHRFSCSASACPDTCCQGWGISIDRETYGKYMSMGGLMGAKLRSHIDHDRRRFLLNHQGRCVFLDRHGLCGLCVDLGEEMMCRTCRIYPRHQESYGELAEVSLSLSCPAAAELVLNLKEPPEYRIRERISGREREDSAEKGLSAEEKELLDGLFAVRRAMFGLLRRTDLRADTRAGAVLALAHDAEPRLRCGDRGGAEAVCSRYETASAEKLENLFAGSREMGFQRRQLEEEYLAELMKLETVSGGWEELLTAARNAGNARPRAGAWRKAGEERVGQERAGQELNLLEYFLYLLYPGAVYDGDGWSKAKLAVFSLLAVRRLSAGLKDGREGAKGETESGNPFVRAAWLYSRQVEHSDANLRRLETFVAESRSCALSQMLACLLGGTE